MKETLIAPCGINCANCRAHHRKNNKCSGCNTRDKRKLTHVYKCSIKNCGTIRTNTSGLCYECDEFPCKRLQKLNDRYKERYGNFRISMIANLLFIKENGIEAFLEKEHNKWKCPECGHVLLFGAFRIDCSGCRLVVVGKEK